MINISYLSYATHFHVHRSLLLVFSLQLVFIFLYCETYLLLLLFECVDLNNIPYAIAASSSSSSALLNTISQLNTVKYGFKSPALTSCFNTMLRSICFYLYLFLHKHDATKEYMPGEPSHFFIVSFCHWDVLSMLFLVSSCMIWTLFELITLSSLPPSSVLTCFVVIYLFLARYLCVMCLTHHLP